MARGGHHGGGSHRGGHHGGGFHGGGHRSFSGRSRHTSSGGHYSSGSYSGGDSDDGLFWVLMVRFGPLAMFFILIGIAYLSCFNVLNVIIMIGSLILFIVASKKNGTTSSIETLKRSPSVVGVGMYDDVFVRGDYGISDGVSWYTDAHFCLSYEERNSRQRNIELSHEEVKKWPFIYTIPNKVWVIGAVIWFIVNFFFYEVVIPYAERARMSDAAFAFIDELVFYLPSIMILLSATTYFVLGRVRLKMAKAVCIKVVDTNITDNHVKITQEEIDKLYELIWFYDICPNCGSEALGKDTRCKFCGTSLKVVDDKKIDKEKCHQVKVELTQPVAKDE